MARLRGWDMGCLLLVRDVIYVLPSNFHRRMPVYVTTYRTLTSPDCMIKKMGCSKWYTLYRGILMLLISNIMQRIYWITSEVQIIHTFISMQIYMPNLVFNTPHNVYHLCFIYSFNCFVTSECNSWLQLAIIMVTDKLAPQHCKYMNELALRHLGHHFSDGFDCMQLDIWLLHANRCHLPSCWLEVNACMVNSEPILGLFPANERQGFFVTTSLIGWKQD